MLKPEVNYALGHPAYAEPMNETMSDRIRTLRKSRNLSQEVLAAALGVTGASVSQWEKGVTKDLKIENFLRFCSYFNCDPHWLAFGESAPPWAPPSPKSRTGTE